MKTFLQLYFIFFCIVLFIKISKTCDCLNNILDPKCTFCSKTPYRCVANYNSSRLNYSGCTEKKIWMLIRHGTRYPRSKYIKSLLNHLPVMQQKILSNYENNNSHINKDLADRFYEWKCDYFEELNFKLATEGKDEMIELAKRMQLRFPTLFPDEYNENVYNFKYTESHRTKYSAKYFYIGLFGKHKSYAVKYSQVERENLILEFYKICKHWKINVKQNPVAHEEKIKFVKSTIMKNALKELSNHLGYEISYDDAFWMRMMCSYETALSKSNISLWCKIFSLDQLKILEYVEDLSYYWVNGYGYKLTYEQSCVALMDMFNFFQSDKNKLTTVYFAHSGTILKLLTLIKIAKDKQPLTHDTFSLFRDNRAWHISLIDAFASNLGFVLYDCQDDGLSILTMHQERAVYLPGCPQNKPCPLQIMKQLYPDNEEECDFETMCSLNNNEL